MVTRIGAVSGSLGGLERMTFCEVKSDETKTTFRHFLEMLAQAPDYRKGRGEHDPLIRCINSYPACSSRGTPCGCPSKKETRKQEGQAQNLLSDCFQCLFYFRRKHLF